MVDWLNAVDFGVPQVRQRLIFVGVKNGVILKASIQAVESFYSKNQFVFWLGGVLLSLLISWLISLCQKVKQYVHLLAEKLCIFKSYKVQLKDIEKKIKEIQMSIADIQAEIELKLVLPK